MSHHLRFPIRSRTFALCLVVCVACQGTDQLGPAGRRTAKLVKVAGDGQFGLSGYPVNVPPTVEVTTEFGVPIANAPVSFSVTAGGGNVITATVLSDARGRATPGAWVIQSGANTVRANLQGEGFLAPPQAFSATGQSAAFNIDLRFLTPATASQHAAFDTAVARWERVIFGDIPDISVNIPAGACFGNEPPVNQVIDDVIIFATLDSIDGPGNILGASTPCFIRSAGRLPLYGVMVFDTADLALLESNGLLGAVVEHEMAHVLGFGTLWDPNDLNLLVGPAAQGGVDPHFVGAQALAAFDAAGGTAYSGGAKVPVENQGGPGTADGHWRETVFVNELMTGYLNFGTNPLSAVTIASFGDEHYQVNDAAADIYTHSFFERAGPAPTLRLGADILRRPIYLMNATGKVTGVFRR